MQKEENNNCFVIMPISDCDGYEKGHFDHVYNDIIKPAIALTDYKAIRADEVKETNLIHLDILKKLIDAPMAVCDLSTRNPKVLFELGIRQAFDRPVVLMQEKDTPKIFDIAPLRYLEYSKDMKYHEVLASQKSLKEAIEATKNSEKDSGNVNSIVKLMAISSPAALPTLDSSNKKTMAMDLLQSQMSEMRMMMEQLIQDNKRAGVKKNSLIYAEYERLSNKLDKISVDKMSISQADRELEMLMRETDELRMLCSNEVEYKMFQFLMERIHRKRTEF